MKLADQLVTILLDRLCRDEASGQLRTWLLALATVIVAVLALLYSLGVL